MIGLTREFYLCKLNMTAVFSFDLADLVSVYYVSKKKLHSTQQAACFQLVFYLCNKYFFKNNFGVIHSYTPKFFICLTKFQFCLYIYHVEAVTE